LAQTPVVGTRLLKYETPKELADHLRAASRKYYGTALPAFIAEYIQRKDAYNETINARCKAFMDRHLKGKDAAGQTWSVCHRFALVAVGGRACHRVRRPAVEQGDATKAADICFAAWAEDRGHLGMHEDEKVITALRSYIGAYQMSRLFDMDDNNARVFGEMVGYKRSEGGRVDFYILPEQMAKILPGLNIKNAMKVIDKRGFLVREPGRECRSGRNASHLNRLRGRA
jgi:hypothetical protein